MTPEPRFPLLGEPLALDLVNTRVRDRGEVVDLLDRPAALDAWLRAEHPRIAWNGKSRRVDLDAIRSLRDALDALLRPRQSGRSPPATAVRALNRVLSAPVPQPRLTWTAAGPQRARVPATLRRAALLRQLALDALELLTGAQAPPIRPCAHPDCILLFAARDPRRRWCSSGTCGNRARVARHYARGHGER